MISNENIDATIPIKLLSHRGPDASSFKTIPITSGGKTITMCHTRLKINGNDIPQPITNEAGDIILIINGEIFNWKELSKELNYTCTQSDCEIIIPLYTKYIRNNDYYDDNIKQFFRKLDGQFSFILFDKKYDTIFVSRDHIGVTPLYYGFNPDFSTIAFASELKALVPFVSTIKVFLPRKYILTKIDDLTINLLNNDNNYLDLYKDINIQKIEPYNIVKQKVNKLLTKSVSKQIDDLLLLDNSPDFGVLLSGGLDSSLIASIASIVSRLTTSQVKTFSIGLPNSVDLLAARKVAKFLGTDHHEYTFTVKEGLNAISEVVWYTETYDTTSIRASTPMYLLIKKIKKDYPDLKVLFSGELSDELLCYLYGSNAPSEKDYQLETINLVSNVHLFDCLRANKTGMANGVEIRVPFTDREFVEYILSLPPCYKTFGNIAKIMGMGDNIIEKKVFRDSFVGYIPDEILYRKKEQFSDGVSAAFGQNKEQNWVESIKNHCENLYNDLIFNIGIQKYNYNKPSTKEQLYYRNLFCNHFNKNDYNNTSEFTVKFWKPKWSHSVDPSAREYSNDQF
jgi:asparagine synthase (glutamine-hydrolysing)